MAGSDALPIRRFAGTGVSSFSSVSSVQVPFLLLYKILQQKQLKSWEDSAVIKSVGSSFRGPEFGSQYPY